MAKPGRAKWVGKVPTNPGPLDSSPYLEPWDRLDEDQVAWLEAYRQSGLGGWPTVTAACRLTGVSRGRYDHWRLNDPDFRLAFADARAEAKDMAHREGGRRAIVGIKEFQFSHGKVMEDPRVCECGCPREAHVRRGRERAGCETEDCDCEVFVGRPYAKRLYSDSLLKEYLRAHVPEFRRKVEVTDGTLAGLDYSQLPDAVLHKIVEMKMHPLQALAAYLEEMGEDVAGLLREGRPEDGEIVQDSPEEDEEL